MGAWAAVALITKTRNLKGSFVAIACDGLPFLLSAGDCVCFAPPALHGPRSACVLQAVQIDASRWEVTFEGIDSIEVAEPLVGSTCLMPRDRVPDVSSQAGPLGWVGYAVVDSRAGALGDIVDIRSSSAQDLLIVEAQSRQVLIPAVDAFIDRIDDDSRIVFVSVPTDLIDLQGE